VLAAMEALKQAIIDADVAELARTWTDDYTFINPQGAIVTRAATREPRVRQHRRERHRRRA